MSAPKTDNCPFCGGDKHMVLPPNCTKTGDYNPGDNAQPIVRCMKCYAEAMGSPWDYTKESAVAAWNRCTDLSQAAVAAALEAAAAKLQNVADNWDCGHNESRLCDCAPYVEQLGLAADEIRYMITHAQHDALAAHVAAEVAKARAEDAEKVASIPPLVSTLIQFINALADECEADLDDVVATVRIMPEGREVAEVSATVVIEKLQTALAQIGAKP